MITVDGTLVSLIPEGTDVIQLNSINEGGTGVLPSDRYLFLNTHDDVTAVGDHAKVQYDGLTVSLRVNALVKSGQNHHVRIVIADVNDDAYDSAVFIGAGSIKAIVPTP